MKNNDKFLIGIVTGIILLVAAAFAVAALRPEPAYQAEDTPEGVARNYLLAIKQADFERAYGYLSPTLESYPKSAEAFTRDVRDSSYNFRLYDESSTVNIIAARVTGANADVTVRENSFNNGGLFDSSESSVTFTLRLRRENEQWKVAGSDQYYWAWCWDERSGC